MYIHIYAYLYIYICIYALYCKQVFLSNENFTACSQFREGKHLFVCKDVSKPDRLDYIFAIQILLVGYYFKQKSDLRKKNLKQACGIHIS